MKSVVITLLGTGTRLCFNVSKKIFIKKQRGQTDRETKKKVNTNDYMAMGNERRIQRGCEWRKVSEVQKMQKKCITCEGVLKIKGEK